MEIPEFIRPLLGGMLIGVAASLLLLLKGQIFGVSGIIAGVLVPKTKDKAWRVASLFGLIAAGLLFFLFQPETLAIEADGPLWRYVTAGLLVGFGTQLGSGCTSGHGVCGISRLSPRSITATLVFISAGMITVALMRVLGVLP